MAKSIAALLKEAGTYLTQYDLGSALQLYREALAREPGNAAAALGMAMVLNRTNKPGEALQLLTRIWASVSRAKQKLPPAAAGHRAGPDGPGPAGAGPIGRRAGVVPPGGTAGQF
jgi:thioredoxin-like negative regulator of GroEL